MNHLPEAILRRMLDEPFSVRDAERQHARECNTCRARQAAIVEDARAAGRLLAPPSVAINPADALVRMRERIGNQDASRDQDASRRSQVARLRGRGLVAAAVAAAALVGVVALTPAGSLAQQFITIFQPSQVTTVQVTSTDLRSLAELRKYGTFHLPKQLPMTRVSDAATASARAAMHVLVPGSLPSGTPSSPTYEVLPGDRASFTFNARKAQAAARADGKAAPPMPAGIDGSTLTVVTRPAVVTVYRRPGDIPALIIGQMRAPLVKSSGVTVRQLEDYVLSMPGISPQLAAQIRSIGDITKTLPVPVVVDITQAQRVTVQGVQGLAIGDQTGVGSGVLWEKGGIIYGVAGPMTEDQAVAVANGLR